MAATQMLAVSLAMVFGVAQGTIMITRSVYTTADCSGTAEAVLPDLLLPNTCIAHGDMNIRNTCNATHKTMSMYTDSTCATPANMRGQPVNASSSSVYENFAFEQVTPLACTPDNDGQTPATYSTTQCTTDFETVGFSPYGTSSSCPASEMASMSYRMPVGCRAENVEKVNGALVLHSGSITVSGAEISVREFLSSADCSSGENTSAAQTVPCDTCHRMLDQANYSKISDCGAAGSEGLVSAARPFSASWTPAVAAALAVAAGALVSFSGAR